ncbi:Shikimate kinase [Thermoanaerobacter ethanolicus JW 200]|uniref:Shikimate kinase n=1 Tax=Thermoanaerobacter siderophilus SR4 TaxID=880478 RepID=I8R6P3_9THEO|nr:shikimate kinase [Thermoanaerobacter siderophilus]EGD52264.1 Shikimate kinase [Thermoanaerobacter ethanolicus JW 200]EIW01270.1 shikimate kinase [Thermoanaerobacter siderophilus SR4]HHY78893.1 shikimate kinase [Thermoanaerobacter sp.]
MKNIVLTGFMATGKTTVGKKVATTMSFGFIDTDKMIEKMANMTVSDIFEKYGEDYFRRLEKAAVIKAARLKNFVIATGGGVVLNPSNIVQLRKNGVVICFTARPEIILRNIGKNKDRPLLMVDNPEEKIRQLLREREPFYRFADYTIDVSDMTIDEVAEEVIKAYIRLKKG